jgi:integrase
MAAENFEKAFEVVRDSGLPLCERAFLATSMSGGLRFTECLSLRPCDLSLADGLIHVRVLKKKSRMRSAATGRQLKISPVYRWVALHPVALALLADHLRQAGAPGFARIFARVKRSTLDRHVRGLFGPLACHHSISRHSHITYRLHALGESPQVVSEQMQITLEVASGYNHIDQRQMVANTWKMASDPRPRPSKT